MTRLRFLLGLVGLSAAAQSLSTNQDDVTDVTRVPLGAQTNAWTVTHAKRPANGQCPVCGTLNEVVFADEEHAVGHPVGTYCDWCSAMFVQRVEKPY